MDESGSPARECAPFFEGQLAHLVGLVALLAGLFACSRIDGFSDGAFLGLSTNTWVALAAGNAIAHQVYVWLCWRAELHGGGLTRRLGSGAFTWYAVGFTVLILARPLLVTAVAISNAGTLPSHRGFMVGLAIVLAVPGVYLVYSVKRYFGFRRAYGVDHFDPGVRTMPLVRQGIFRFSSNAMYDFGFLLLWVPGLVGQSVAALAVALFSHLYIWVHFFCTERPDMKRIYG